MGHINKMAPNNGRGQKWTGNHGKVWLGWPGWPWLGWLGLPWLSWLAWPRIGLACLSAWLVLANSNNNGGAKRRPARRRRAGCCCCWQGRARLRGKPSQGEARQAKTAKASQASQAKASQASQAKPFLGYRHIFGPAHYLVPFCLYGPSVRPIGPFLGPIGPCVGYKIDGAIWPRQDDQPVLTGAIRIKQDPTMRQI